MEERAEEEKQKRQEEFARRGRWFPRGCGSFQLNARSDFQGGGGDRVAGHFKTQLKVEGKKSATGNNMGGGF